ncbi:hypothetical protein CGQ39_12535 [Clostridium botulinum]|uniref:hypothetical protein n=1 Tax=Clostridium botulinum TaxID=1491 RepID=UPI00046322FF|nr:hypothetical protein [Clostridium botulinum]AUN19076.1 hypothetical protein B2M06_16245 [Clostridium botulinum]MCS4471136.1 hypothetical protein [Clostridium botulinum]MCS4474820.1 hypothetical protein [Clostridium botulinum]OSA86454.1 hypothetical protein B2H91_10710 [Clostridium botulinum]QDY21743.1 hypothetical protein CGQ39_12535 [Clostridium botulinum]
MLDKKSKQVLNALNKAKNDIDHVNGSRFLIKHLPKEFTNSEIDKILFYLQENNYIECCKAGGTILDIYVRYEAQNYKEFEWLQTKEFIYKSVLVPILVSISTSGIIYLLTTYCFK